LSVPGGSLVGRTIGGYQILKLVGKGGMGEVYLAEQVRLKRKVAFKALKGSRARDKAAMEAFHREAISAAQLSHANIVQVIDIAMVDNVPFITMEFVEGETLQAVLSREKKLPVEKCASIARQVLEALAAAHRKGIVHRDIKPGNIMLDVNGVVKVTDFGLAKMMEEETPADGERRYGTILYMPPEQIRSSDVGPKADLYSVGATLYHIMTGQPPFKGADARETLKLVAAGNAVDPCLIEPSIPKELGDLVLGLLEKDPNDRFPDAAAALEQLALAEKAMAPPAGGALARLPKWALAVGAVVIVAALAGGALGLKAVLAPKKAAGPTPEETARAEEAKKLALLQEMMDYAKGYERQHPDKYGQVLANYEKVAQDGQGTKFALEASAKIAEVKERQAKAAEAIVSQARAKAMALADKKEYAKAKASLTEAPKGVDGLSVEDKLAEVAGEVSAKEKAEIDRLLRLVNEKASRKEYDKAQEFVAQLTALGTADATKAAAEGTAAIRRKRAEADAAQAAESRRRLQEMMAGLKTLTERRDYDKALAECAKALSDSRLKSMASLVEREKKDLEAAQEVLKTTLEAMRAGKTDGVKIKGVRYNCTSVTGDTIGYAPPGNQRQVRTLPLAELERKEMARLVEAAHQPLVGATRLRVILFLLYDGSPREAKEMMGEAAKAGEQMPAYLKERWPALK